jgi:pantoate--beta-alanine ligase
MKIFRYFNGLKKELLIHNAKGDSIGFVPTMGALHEGHLSLIHQSKALTDFTVCSIFVNPEQFNSREDFLKYPSTIERDIELLRRQECDYLFIPDEDEIYPDKKSKSKHFDLGYLETILEGAFRPGHFQGVSLVIERLLSQIDPDYILMGQKDFQQCMVVKKVIELIHSKTKVISCPIIRESSGLAMSSRNMRLSDEEKIKASKLFSSLEFIRNNRSLRSFSDLKDEAISTLQKEGFNVEYLAMAKTKNLELTDSFQQNETYVLLIAAFLNKIRLIDNLVIAG